MGLHSSIFFKAGPRDLSAGHQKTKLHVYTSSTFIEGYRALVGSFSIIDKDEELKRRRPFVLPSVFNSQRLTRPLEALLTGVVSYTTNWKLVSLITIYKVAHL
jgi:hypothetical protein